MPSAPPPLSTTAPLPRAPRSGRARGRAAGWIAAVSGMAGLVLAGATGCAPTPPGGPTPAGSTSAVQEDAVAPYEAPVTGVRPGPDAHSVLIQVTYPTDTGSCYGPPESTYVQEGDSVVSANVVMARTGTPPSGSCPAQGTATLTTTAPVGTRFLVLNQQPWRLAGDAYERCDAELGCAPPADHCDLTWTLKAFNGLDVPRHAGRHIEHCDQQWLVMTVDINSAACGAGGRPGCSAPPSVARYVFRWASAWLVAVRTVAAGCAPILAAVPEFPRQICASLPATK